MRREIVQKVRSITEKKAFAWFEMVAWLVNGFVLGSVVGFIPVVVTQGMFYWVASAGRQGATPLLPASTIGVLFLMVVAFLFSDNPGALIDQAYNAKQPLVVEAFRIEIFSYIYNVTRHFVGLVLITNVLFGAAALGWLLYGTIFTKRPDIVEATDVS